jgi:hypothetical protein
VVRGKTFNLLVESVLGFSEEALEVRQGLVEFESE